MNVNAVSQQAAPPQGAGATSQTTIADFQDFLKLFVSQLQYQDPLNPTGGEEFLAQTAQFSTVEQLVNLNRRAETAVEGGEILRRATAAGYLGRSVTAWAGDGEARAQVTGRVVSVEFADDGSVALGLDTGQEVSLADVTYLSES